MVAYIGDYPRHVRRFLGDGPPVPIGRITTTAGKHFGGFPAVYRTLLEYTHPAWRAAVTSHQVLDEPEGTVLPAWESAPRFKSKGDAPTACALAWEPTEAHEHLLRRTAEIRAVCPRIVT